MTIHRNTAFMTYFSRFRFVPVAALAVTAAACTDQPDPYCISTVMPFAMKLTQTDLIESAPGACEPFLRAYIDQPLLGVWPYYERGTDGQPDYERGSVAIQTENLGTSFYAAQDQDIGNTAAEGQLYSQGAFTSARPDDQNFCSVPELSPTRVVLAEVPAIPDDPETADEDESVPAREPVDSTLTWSNVRVYVTAATFGTQMDADFTDVRVSPTGDTCTLSYRALGLAPAVPCGATDADGAPLVNEDGTYQVDEEACSPQPNVEAGRPAGSGIAPNVRYTCDPVTAYCVVAGDSIPSLL